MESRLEIARGRAESFLADPALADAAHVAALRARREAQQRQIADAFGARRASSAPIRSAAHAENLRNAKRNRAAKRAKRRHAAAVAHTNAKRRSS